MDNEFINQIDKLHKTNEKSKKQCLYGKCSKIAINSHLLQKKGILNQLTDGTDNHLMRLQQTNMFSLLKTNEKFRFEKIGIEKAMGLELFCPEHDNNLFDKIEKNTPKFNDYPNQILFSYRAVCGEIRRKKLVAKFESDIIDAARHLPESKFIELHLQDHIKGLQQGIKDISYYKKSFEKEMLNKHSKNFIFKTFIYEFLPICCSALFTPLDFSDDTIYKSEKAWKVIFVNIIPSHNRLYIILGHHKNHINPWIKDFINSWNTLDVKLQQKNISELFATRLETWAMSVELFNTIPENIKIEYIKFYENNYLNHDENMHFGQNIFENYTKKG